MNIEQFVDRSKIIFRDNLKSVVLFGSAVEKTPPPKRNVDLMLVFSSLQLDQLTSGARLIRRWMAQGNPEPLLIDAQHIANSLDVFPMEFADMKERHRILWGEPVLQDIRVNKRALRLQCEREIKQKLLLLRERTIALYPKRRALSRLLEDSLSAALAIVRSTLRVVGDDIPQSQADQVRQLAARGELNLSSLLEILEARQQKQRLSRSQVLELLERYLTSLEELATYIDTLEEALGL